MRSPTIEKEIFMRRLHPLRRPTRSWLLAVLVAALLVPALSTSAALASSSPKPTVVLVHGAFADASGWSGVIERLEDRGYPVIAPANPMRGVSADAAYLRTFLATIEGPIVLVGHSYGGVVISNAATGNPNVKALVYVAAYAPDLNDTVLGLSKLGTDDLLGQDTLKIRPFPPGGATDLEGYIVLSRFREIFAGDLPRKQARAMALSQRPAALAALGEPSGVPAWRSIPTWYMVAGRDRTIGTDVERAMAKRIPNVHKVEVKGASHVVMMSRPDETTRFILRAAGSRK
jgi:pimeloyl-ACP methyl ester carboxylesterase